MAKKESRFKNIKVINSTLKTINTLMDGIYKSTYNTDRNSMDSVNKVTKDLEDNIASIISNNSMSDINNISKLYSRMKMSEISGSKEFKDSVTSLFEDPSISANILSMYTENKWIRDLDHEYDMILKYMPKLQEALDAKKENVLSSDNFSKEFLNDSSKNLSDPTSQALFSSRIENMHTKYKLQVFYEESYDRAAKYGEDFVYCVPYNKAISALLKNKNNTRTRIGLSRTANGIVRNMNESSIKEFTVLEHGIASKNFSELNKKIQDFAKINQSEKLDIPKNLKLTIDNSGVLESAYREYDLIVEGFQTTPRSIYESIMEASKEEVKFDNTIPEKLEIPKEFDKVDKTSNDGFIYTSVDKNTDVKVPGSVLKRLKRENIIPIYIEQVCLGYYYIEFMGGASYDAFLDNNHMYSKNNILTGFNGRDRNFSVEAIEKQRNDLLSYFAGCIANQINASFVSSNQDLASEIYTILKFNDVFNSYSLDNIRISFLPANDVEHIFFKQDPDTHRGISDLAFALIPAKLYACLYMTNTLGILTRGQDKRVYYVKQNVEQNIAQTMLNVINQIKRGNFGMREIENMNTILNITGRFNDYVIPVGPSGDPPVQFEVMQGQEFNPNTELMDRLEEMAINSTGMPIEFIQNRMQSLDFAIQATTVNAKVLRSTYKRQSIFEYYLSRIETKIYNAEYNENINITCGLPSPLFLHMTNINQMIENTKAYVQAIADYEYEPSNNTDNNNESKKAIFIRNMMRKKLMAYLKLDEVEEMKALAELEFNRDNNKQEE